MIRGGENSPRRIVSGYVLACRWCDTEVTVPTAKPRLAVCEQCAAEVERQRREQSVSSG
jgi:uncharacterized paraquat-inducible protein A